jgi:hypothetical protein
MLRLLWVGGAEAPPPIPDITPIRAPRKNGAPHGAPLFPPHFPPIGPGFLGERLPGQPQGSRFESCNPQMVVSRMSNSCLPSFLCHSTAYLGPRSWISTVRLYHCCANYIFLFEAFFSHSISADTPQTGKTYPRTLHIASSCRSYAPDESAWRNGLRVSMVLRHSNHAVTSSR